MTDFDYIEYFKKLAVYHRSIAHSETGKAFFFIENADDLEAFDDALRSTPSHFVMLMCFEQGELDDSGSENHVDEVAISIYILIRKGEDRDLGFIKDESKKILMDMITRTKRDFRKSEKKPTFNISKIPYQSVGPMKDEWYGRMAVLSFVCPFGYTVDSGTWSDITD